MVIRPRIRAFLAALGLYVLAALFIGYFGINAYTGNHGIVAKQNLDQRIAQDRRTRRAGVTKGVVSPRMLSRAPACPRWNADTDH